MTPGPTWQAMLRGSASRIAVADGDVGEHCRKLCLEQLDLLLPCGMCKADTHLSGRHIVCKAGRKVALQGIRHHLFCLFQGLHFLESVELAALDLQNGLDPQDGADERRRGRQSSALFEILQRLQREVNAAVFCRILELFCDLLGAEAALRHREGVIDAVLQGDGNAAVVDDLHPALIEGARHGDVDHVAPLFEEAFPHFRDARRRGLRGGNGRILFKMLVKLCLREVDILEILLAIDDKRHGDDGNSQSFRLGLCDAAVGIGDDLYHCHDRFSNSLFLFTS